ncbi:hypothetical protein ABL78_0695 [Leptomonas seymouri]|uniref:Guanine nucleotide-binding protein subunit beta-like protein n=1 Tax=Leptomonas seymouri TaxID=5684 RepID=A0A0N0P916_LEPSE|nr:hypothetical protein ABL78_0695 [Leptomonas seymouri]|eukprot:KPI90177.1 hypothetical protein ABL78_0695 [Leptomonas seymouri]
MCSTWSVDLGNEEVQRQCLSATNEAVWWVSTTGVLYTWRGNAGNDGNEEVPDPVALVQLDSRAHFMTLCADTVLVVTSHYLSLFSIVRENAPLFLHNGSHDAEQPPHGVEYGEAVDESNVNWEVVITVEPVLRLPCRLSEVRDGDINCDASCAALCSPLGLYVVDCAPCTSEMDTSGASQINFFECTQVGASTRGCRFACFSGVTQLVLMDEANHLLLLRCDVHQENCPDTYDGVSRGGQPVKLELLVDGHVLTRTARATALACSHSAVNASIIVIGFSSGQVRVIDGESLQQLRTWDVTSALLSHTPTSAAVVAAPSRRLMREPQPSRPSRGVYSPISRIDDNPPPSGPTLPVPVLDVAVGGHLFTISTPQGVFYYDRHTFQLRDCYSSRFEAPLVRVDDGVTQRAEEQILFRSAPDGSWCYADVVERTLHYAPAGVDAQHSAEQRDTDEELATTDVIHALVPLPSAWLSTNGLATLKSSACSSRTNMTPSSSFPTTGKTVGSVSARRSAKGSGYGDAPWSVQQDRKRKMQAAAAKDRKAQAFGLPPASSAKGPRFQYHSGKDHSTIYALYAFQQMEALTSALRHLHTRAVLAATFDTAGGALVTASGDSSAQQLQYPIVRSKRTGDVVGRALSGHAAAVTSVDTNLSRQQRLVLTGCADGKLRLWAPGSQETPVAEVVTGVAGDKAGAAPSAVACAQFFYLDKFVLSCAKDRLELRCHTDAVPPTTSIGTQPSPSRLSKSPVYRYTVGVGHTITSASAMNHFASNIVVLATSEKEIQVLDVAADTILWTNSNTHTRTIYRVALGRTSRHAAAMSTAAAHLFASAALDGTVALWDARTDSPVQLYTQHSNSAIASLGLELSPGNEMVAVASQDNRVYLYDIRKGGGGCATASAVLHGFETYVTSLAWHPLQPILAAGLANGGVQLFHHTG